MLTIRKLFMCLALILAGAIVSDPIKAQPVGGPTTGGNDPTGGNTTGGNTPGGNVNTGGNVGVNVGEERRYIVEFANFIVLDETGCDLCGSDEVLFVIRTSDYALLSREYEADSSYRPWPFEDTSPVPYEFKRCALPAVDADSSYDNEWECGPRGKAPPLSFTIAAWENDDTPIFQGFCGQNINDAPNPLGPDLWRPDEEFCVERHGELIGKVKVEFKIEDLNELQSPGQEVVKEVELFGGCDFTERTDCEDTAPKYRLRYVIKRVPDATVVPVDPNP
jgi:hypothetical protein